MLVLNRGVTYSVGRSFWTVANYAKKNCYRQEGVSTNTYFPKTVAVCKCDEAEIECRTYQLTDIPTENIRGHDTELPFERRPSITYLDCIIKGAMECKLPEDYIENLKNVPHNGQASPHMQELLGG